jgi:predicted AlkP superfamily phosphohydrolase/phosphomutase
MALFRKKKKKPAKVMVVGLDGVPYTLLKKLIADGVTPNMGKIFGGGNFVQMQVVYPEISAVSWPSFMTGKDPGGHGIFGFTDLLPDSYDIFFPQFPDLKAPTIWDRLGEKGKRSIIINQPSTYPAKKIEGVLISGFVAVDIFKSVQPTKYLGALKRANYEVDIDTARARKNADFLFSQLDRTLKARKAAFDILREKEEWDFLELVITGTDRMQHYQMHAVMDESQENHQRTLDYYSKVDDLVGHAFECYCRASGTDGAGTDGEDFIMLSDHGFTLIEREVYLMSWLEENGYLSFEGEGRTLGDISADSKAFSLDPGRIFIHRQGKYPKGCVGDDEAKELIKEIRGKLLELRFEGKPVIRDAFSPEQVYSGPHVKQAADLIVWGHDGFDLKSSTAGEGIFRQTDLTGMHTQHDAFLYTTGEFSDGCNITELADYIVAKF